MNNLTSPVSTSRSPTASKALLTAALSGLLCFASACDQGPSMSSMDSSLPGDSAPDPNTITDAAADTRPAIDSSADATASDVTTSMADAREASADAATASEASAPDSAVNDSAAPDAATPDAMTALDVQMPPMDVVASDGPTTDTRVLADTGCDIVNDRVIVSSEAGLTGITLDVFTAMCDRAHGFVEVHPHCGGFNSCHGFSWDETLSLFTEHSCAGLNTCTGYTCVIPP